MTPYFLFFVIVLLLLFLYHKTNNEFYFNTCFIIIFLFAALRGNGSGDYFHYLDYSKSINTIYDVLNFNFPMEIGFRIIAYIKNMLQFPNQFVIIIMNMISTYLTYYAIKHYSTNKILSTLIFLPIYLQFDMHATRSAIAASFTCIALFYYWKRIYISSLLFLIGAICFHKSVLIILLIPIIDFCVKKIKSKTIIIIELFLLVISFLPLFSYISNFLETLGINNILFLKLYNYIFVSKFAYPISYWDPRVIVSLLIFISSSYLMYNNKIKYKVAKNINIIAFCNIFLILLFHDSTFLAYRLSSFYDRILIILLPYIISNIDFSNLEINIDAFKNKLIKNILMIVERNKNLLVSVYYCLFYIALVILTCVPYKFFF